ncbi:MAG: hypothetical protein V4694_03310 [Pseudomonadota bacterium]
MSKPLLTGLSKLAVTRFPKPNQTRSISSINLTLPRDSAEECLRQMTSYYQQFQSADHILKPLTQKEAFTWHDEFSSIIKSRNPEFLDTLEDVRQNPAQVALLDGILFPKIEHAEIPTTNVEMDSALIKKLRPAEISLIAFSKMLGVKPDDYLQNKLLGYIYATESERYNPSSFKSSNKPLKWHNDGWGSGEAIPYVMILSIVGHENALTEVISGKDIVDHFVKNGKEHLLEPLNKYILIQDPDSFLDTPINVLDAKTNKVNFADYGFFKPTRILDYKLFKEAFSFFKQTLEVVPRISINLEAGQLLRLPNQEHLHQRDLKPDPNNMILNLVGTRLGVRMLGSKDDGDKSI